MNCLYLPFCSDIKSDYRYENLKQLLVFMFLNVFCQLNTTKYDFFSCRSVSPGLKKNSDGRPSSEFFQTGSYILAAKIFLICNIFVNISYKSTTRQMNCIILHYLVLILNKSLITIN